MPKNKNRSEDNMDNLEDEYKIEEEDEKVNDELEENEEREPLFPFDKMTYQEKGEIEPSENLHEYEMGEDQKLNLGESPSRKKRRTLNDERGAGHEP